ncbi:hypothetical protein IPG36_05100 [bacterium]|nr:MAG: hypothetical protein IPG36_05100 [bacterium]
MSFQRILREEEAMWWLLAGAVWILIGILVVTLERHDDIYYSFAWKAGGAVVAIIGSVVIVVAMAHGDRWTEFGNLLR